MEVCVDSVESAINAEKGGAARVELCSNLIEGGTTPSLGMLKVMKQKCSIPVFVMIRPRGGDFLYTDEEFEVMKEDIKVLKQAGADGIVFGVLTSDGEVDARRCKVLLDLAKPLPTTFHRAFDMAKDPFASVDVLVKLGYERVLTSGRDSSALEGLPLLRELVEWAQGKIIVVPGATLNETQNMYTLSETNSPGYLNCSMRWVEGVDRPDTYPGMWGGGITERNLERILKGSGAKEFHCSARHSVQSYMTYKNTDAFMGGVLRPPEFVTKIASVEKVSKLILLAKTVFE